MFHHQGKLSLQLKTGYYPRSCIPSCCAKLPRLCVNTSRYLASESKQNPSNEDTLIDPRSPSSNHHDLKSFLAYTQRSGLNEKSTVYVGTHYEYTTAARLARYGFSLQRVGGSFDFGTDLLGTWTPQASSSTVLRVLIQCKASMHRTGPFLIRELEGAFGGAPPGWRGPETMALLVTERPATKGVRGSLGRSRWPMGYVCCSREGAVRQMIWNNKAEEAGLEGFGVTARHVEGVNEAELVLTRHGEPLPLLDGIE